MRRSWVTVPSRSYRTLASTGYIITSSPMLMGSETPSTSTAASAVPMPGTTRPSRSPTTMAARIHTGR